MPKISAGAIAMGLGGYLAARSDAQHYDSERRREEEETLSVPDVEAQEIATICESYGITPEASAPVIGALRLNRKAWVDFMMRFELGLDKPEPTRARNSALTIGSAYIGGGLIPLLPYMLQNRLDAALRLSVAVTLLALLVFGFVKGRFVGARPVRSALQTVLIGGVAATAAFMIARAIG